jgi:hypothetical protein
VFSFFRAFVVGFFIAVSVKTDGMGSSRSYQAADKQDPCGNLQTGNHECQNKSDFGSRDDTAGRTPVTDDHKKNDGRRNNGKPHKYHRDQRDIQSNFIIADAMVFQILYAVFGFSGFQTQRTKMPVVELNVTQRTQKPATGRTGDGRLFTGMIKATGFFLRLQWISGPAGGQFTKKGRVDIRTHRFLACRTWDQRESVDRLSAERCFALGTRKHRTPS